MTVARVVLLIPHHEDLDGLVACLRSVRESDPVDVLVVDDGSSQPPTLADLRRACRTSGEVYLDVLPENQGIARALNHGVHRCHDLGYEFIARLDAGDRNRPGRLGRQLAAFDRDASLGAVGAWAQVVDEDGQELFVIRAPASHDEILRQLCWGMPMVHPSMMLRTALVRRVGGYPEDLPAAEDLGLVARIAPVARLANLPEVLIDYEQSHSSISTVHRREQLISRIRVIRALPVPAWRRAWGIARTLVLLLVSRETAGRLRRWLRRDRERGRVSRPGRGAGRRPSGRG